MNEEVFMMPTNDPIVLVIEDDEPKLKSVVAFLKEAVVGVNIKTADSLSSAIRELSTHSVAFAIIDMSLPTYDAAKDRTGGQPQGFGGVDILRFIDSETPSTYSVILTQYEEFPSGRNGNHKDLQSLKADIHKEFGSRCLDVIFYSGQLGEWRDALLTALTNAEISTK
jgi:CheY-like chemotaxis protein